MAEDLNAGPWPDEDTALRLGGIAIKSAAHLNRGSVHGWLAVCRRDGQYGIRGAYSTKSPGSHRLTIHYVKAGIDDTCGYDQVRYRGGDI